MKTFDKLAAQGDLLIIKIDELPTDISPLETNDDCIIIAHSETGHNHIMEKAHVKAFVPKKPDIYQMFIQVDEPTPIEHLRSFDTHEPIMVTPGTYEIRRQREYTPKGYRRVAD